MLYVVLIQSSETSKDLFCDMLHILHPKHLHVHIKKNAAPSYLFTIHIRSTMLRFSKISALGAVFHVLSHICARVLFFLLEGFACKNIRKRVCVNARVKPAAFLNALARARLCVFLIESPPGKLTGPRVAQPQISHLHFCWPLA